MDRIGITKTQIKTLTIFDKYKYRVMLVDAGGSKWLEALPIWKGYCRTAENEEILKILLENDILSIEKREKMQQKVR